MQQQTMLHYKKNRIKVTGTGSDTAGSVTTNQSTRGFLSWRQSAWLISSSLFMPSLPNWSRWSTRQFWPRNNQCTHFHGIKTDCKIWMHFLKRIHLFQTKHLFILPKFTSYVLPYFILLVLLAETAQEWILNKSKSRAINLEKNKVKRI